MHALMHAMPEAFKIVILLIEHGADIHVRNESGWTALMYASSKGSFEMAKLLLENGADPNISNNSGETALMCAAYQGCVEIVKLLVEKGANVTARDKKGERALDKKGRITPEIISVLTTAIGAKP
jgi:uncharacterized protein